MSALAAGFADAPHDAQRVFRAVLDAFAHPGRIVRLPANLEAPTALSTAAAAFLLTLVDRDTPLWLAPDFDKDDVRAYLRFHTGTPLAAHQGDALFALVSSGREGLLDGFNIGTDAYPDRSATLLIEASDLRTGPAVTLRGPGIDGTAQATVAGLAAGFWRDWAANNALFPCGVDVVFAAGSELLALPRSIAVEAPQCT